MTTSPDIFHVVLFSYHRGHILSDGTKSLPGHIFAGFHRNFQTQAIKGHSPRKGYIIKKKVLGMEIPVPNLGWSGNHDERHHLKDYQHRAAFRVSRENFEAALNVRRSFYIIGLNDCVSYVSEVCHKAGLTTPDMTDCILTPIAYFDYIKEHNTPDSTFIASGT